MASEDVTPEPSKFERTALAAETVILGLLLALMLILASTQIVLRNVFEQGISWADPLIRVLVLWLGLLGAVAAARRDKHIRIDLLTHYLSPFWNELLRLMGHVVTSVVAALIAWHGGRLVLLEWEFEDVAFLDIPAWVLQLVIPASFGMIGLFYLAAAIVSVRTMTRKR